MKKLHKKKTSITYNRDVRKWFHFAIETLIMSIVGALIGFFFQGSWTIGFIVFGFLVVALLIYLLVLVVNEHRVSIIAIMKSGLVDERFEDVILYGYAMSQALFTSNQNRIRVQLGELMLEAVQKILEAKFNSHKGRYLISINSEQKTLIQIKAELLIDDVGWSRHLADADDTMAIQNIISGMKLARGEVKSIFQDENINPDDKAKKIVPFAKIIVKAYRHLAGIYYEKQETLDKAKHIENILRIIMSNKNILTDTGVCSDRNKSICECIPGAYCTKGEKRDCIKENIANLYFYSKKQAETPSIKLDVFLDFNTFGNITESDIEDDVTMFAMLPAEPRKSMVKEQCYAWSRNIVKKLPKMLYMKGDRFVSDDEWLMMIEEAVAFADLYYYGPGKPALKFATIVNSEIIGKRELRYLRLLCETTQRGLIQQKFGIGEQKEFISSNQKNDKVETLISMLTTTRELCRGKRTELFVRCSAELIDAYRMAYNLNYRFSMSKDCREMRENQIKVTWDNIVSIRNETRRYQHRDEYMVEKAFAEAQKEYRIWKKELKTKIIFKDATSCKDDIEALNASCEAGFVLEDKLPIPTEEEILSIKRHWGVQ